jgi:hypothetical protein
MVIPQQLLDFCAAQITLDNLCLPQQYPDVNNFNAFQVGYRFHGNTAASLVSEQPGAFQPGWYVICSNYFGDPFYVDIHASAVGFPVYFSWHGAGQWTPVLIADTLAEFKEQLELLKAGGDFAFDLTNEFWKEVAENNSEPEVTGPAVDMSEWIQGAVYITDIGSDKTAVTNFLKGLLKLTPKDALLLSRQAEIKVKEGYLLHMKHLMEQLRSLGATATFRSM